MRLPQLAYRRLFEFFLFVILEVIAIVLVSHNEEFQGTVAMSGVRDVNAFVWKQSAALKNYFSLKDINKVLSEQNKLLLEQNNLYKEFIIKEQGEDKLEELSNLIALNTGNDSTNFTKNFDFILARVIKNTRGSQHNYLIIDKGSKDGIIEDLGVITPNGVVGIIRGVGKKYSYVLSFLNVKQVISAKVSNSAVYGTLEWDGVSIDKARLKQIPLNVEINPGDTIFTSGNSFFFPSDIPIGIAGDFNVSSGISKDIEVSLFQDFRDLDYVIVVKNNERVQIDSLSNITPIQNNR